MKELPSATMKITEKNRGKAVLDPKSITIGMKKRAHSGPAAVRSRSPRAAAEVMANVKYGILRMTLICRPHGL